jgi:hypothetical protein
MRPRHLADPAPARPSSAQTVPWVLAVALAVLAPLASSAQNLPATPLNWQFPLPAAPLSMVPAAVDRERQGSFLKGRFLLGVNLTHSLTPDDDLGSHWSVSPVIRNTPRRLGWGPSFGLSGYSGDIVASVDGLKTTIGEIKIRPLMGGIAYSIGGGRLRTSFGLVGGYAFTSAKVTAALPPGTSASINIDDAWVVRPNVGFTFAATRRLALVGSIGYVYTNPTIAITVNQPGQLPRRLSGSFRSDYVSLTMGTAISIF